MYEDLGLKGVYQPFFWSKDGNFYPGIVAFQQKKKKKENYKQKIINKKKKKKKKVLTIYKNAWISLCWDFCIEHYVYDICNLLCHICLSISFLRSV